MAYCFEALSVCDSTTPETKRSRAESRIFQFLGWPGSGSILRSICHSLDERKERENEHRMSGPASMRLPRPGLPNHFSLYYDDFAVETKWCMAIPFFVGVDSSRVHFRDAEARPDAPRLYGRARKE